jgi:hypothetical protein
LSSIHRLPAKSKAILLIIIGLAFGIWLGYGSATGNIAYSQSRLIFEITMLLTFVWMLIWTIRKNLNQDY